MPGRTLGIGCLLAVLLASAGSSARAAPAPFTLTFDGTHVVDSSLPAGLRHDGRFTASAPFCSAGRAYDVRDLVLEPLTVLRVHTCDDRSGSFTALMTAVRGEHGGSGPWKIVEGTGRFEKLRGLGTYTGQLISGDPDNFPTVVYRTVWSGLVDFDTEPPAAALSLRATKLKRPRGAYSLRITLTVPAEEAGVRYTLDIRAGRALLDLRNGSTTSGKATLKLVIRPPRTARSARVIATVSDTVGNESTTTRVVKLR